MKRETLTEAEREFVAEMRLEDYDDGSLWRNFDPDFRQRDIARLFKRGWFEKKADGRYREYRWTAAGRQALADREAQDHG